ncbi:hypothetical protein A7U43_27785 (plasmid) [Mycobacterium adipatum]|uniref:ABC transporter domain-containing protein n=1 Tax=Mycobacterium adipatum TaxID=1682113 RepID=A0A172UW23_9MYCO|nr:hypothetical protein A7U43_27785 [Mycobacterium adipatum]
MLILDEAMAALDQRSERALSSAITELRKGRTTFEIAHRLTRVRDADAIIVLRAGRIVESGTHEELISIEGEYWSLCHAWDAT